MHEFTAFARLFDHLRHVTTLPGITSHLRDDSGRLFPCHLPYPSAYTAPSTLGMSTRTLGRLEVDRRARRWVNEIFAIHRYFSIGSPKAHASYSRVGPVGISALQLKAVEAMLCEVQGYCSARGAHKIASQGSRRAVLHAKLTCEVEQDAFA